MPENESNERYVLFSQLGMTDPVNGNYDGPFLHILRYYHPEKAVLFMTKEVHDSHCKDDRFQFFASRVAPETEIEIDAHPEIVNAHNFDVYGELFRKALTKLHKENPDCKLLVNISSGTPQMQATLYLMSATLPFEITPVQVATPAKKSNLQNKEASRPDFNPQASWENLLDNYDELRERRCENVALSNVRRAILLENMKGRAEAYDYEGALALAKTANELFAERGQMTTMIEAAKLRLNLEGKESQDLLKKAGIDAGQFFPPLSNDLQPCYEYIQMLGIHLKRKYYSDFARSVSPAITWLLLHTLKLKKEYNVDVNSKLCTKDDDYIYWLSRDKIEAYNPDLLNKLDTQVRDRKTKKYKRFSEGAPAAANLLRILEALIEINSANQEGAAENMAEKHLVDDFEKLREFERKIRHLAAHELRPITEKQIENKTSATAKEILSIMQRRFAALPGVKKPLAWDGYDKMNEAILSEK